MLFKVKNILGLQLCKQICLPKTKKDSAYTKITKVKKPFP